MRGGMRTFNSEDGRTWIARIHDGIAERAAEGRTGWEVVQFDSQPPGTVQRITYRPSGWLALASIQELIEALREGETVRTVWKER